MTTQRKDEMPEAMYFGICKHYGIKLYSETKTAECPFKYNRADLSPPVPDDVAEAVKKIRAYQASGWKSMVDPEIETLIRAVSQPKLYDVDKTLEVIMSDIDADHNMSGGRYHKLKKAVETIRAASTPSAEVPVVTAEQIYNEFKRIFQLSDIRDPLLKIEDMVFRLAEKYPHGLKIKALNQPHTGGK